MSLGVSGAETRGRETARLRPPDSRWSVVPWTLLPRYPVGAPGKLRSPKLTAALPSLKPPLLWWAFRELENLTGEQGIGTAVPIRPLHSLPSSLAGENEKQEAVPGFKRQEGLVGAEGKGQKK